GSVDSVRAISAAYVRICDCPWSMRAQFIPDLDLTGLDHLAVHAAIGMAEVAQQRFRDRKVAHAGVGIDVGCRATHDPFHDLDPSTFTDRNLLAEQVELEPRRPALDIDIATKAQRIDRRSDRGLEGSDRCEIDDRHDLARNVGKAMAWRVQHL